MSVPELHKVKDLLDWSYANLAAYRVALTQDPPRFTRNAWMARAKLFKGLQDETMNRSSIYKNERAKLSGVSACSYCGKTDVNLTLDHLFAQSSGGADSGDNLVYVCRKCNSSKGAKDYFVWCKEKGIPVNPDVAERYLKNAYVLCKEADILDVQLEDAASGVLPFDLENIPTRFDIVG